MKKIRYMFEALFLVILLGISKLMPASWASNVGGFIGRTIGPKLAATRKAHNNVQMVYPNKTPEEIQTITTGMWENLGRVMMEYPHIEKISRNHTKIINFNVFEKYKNQAAIYISAHTGNWEICPPAFFYKSGTKVNPVYRAPNNPYSDFLLNKARHLKGALSPIPKSRGGTRQMVKTLKDNEGIGILIDQKFNQGIKADFFGYPAKTSDHFATLAQKFNCPIIPLQIERDEGINFTITVHSPLDTQNKSNAEIVDITHSIIEDWINKRPEQWLWLHRRWMTQAEIERHEHEHTT
jgi:KDO2-lipid IV(A) lauroyltransferase